VDFSDRHVAGGVRRNRYGREEAGYARVSIRCSFTGHQLSVNLSLNVATNDGRLRSQIRVIQNVNRRNEETGAGGNVVKLRAQASSKVSESSGAAGYAVHKVRLGVVNRARDVLVRLSTR